MSEGTTHINRSQQRYKLEALCGATPADGEAIVCMPADMATCWKCILLECGKAVPAYPQVPEHDRLREAKKTDDATQMLGKFVFEFLPEEEKCIAERGDDGDLYEAHGLRDLVAKFFGINQNAIESEKQALLEYMQAIHEATEWAKTEGRQILKART